MIVAAAVFVLVVSSLIVAALHVGLAPWTRRHRIDPAPPGVGVPPVRVVVPARDEANTIGACVTGVLASEGVDVELVVVDDSSSDGTAEIAVRAAAGDPRLSVVPAGDRPAGWAGKPWACAVGASGSDRSWLLFVDADVRLAPAAVRTALYEAANERADLLSWFGSWDVVTLGEQVAVPAVGWFVRGASDPDGVAAGRAAFANGQFLLVRRSAYEAWGGHEAVRAEVLDDVKLAATARASGGRLRLKWAPWAFRVRPYESLGDLVEGYRKNLYEGMGRRPVVAVAAAAAVALTTVVPIAALGLVWVRPWLGLWALAVVLAQLWHRVRLERLDGRTGLVAPLQPAAGLILAWILVLSAVSRRVTWKGRAFQDGQDAAAPEPDTKAPSPRVGEGAGLTGAGEET